MQRDVTQFTTSKLQGGWSAADFGKYLTKQNLLALLPRFDKLEPLVRVRLLLSVLSLDDAAKQDLQAELKTLATIAREDKEEWVSVTAKALGSFEGPLDLEAVQAGSAFVRKTLADLERQVEAGGSGGFRPMEELYLSKALLDTARGGPEPAVEHSHFSHREVGATSLPELSRRASASAAAAAASVQAANPGSPAHPSFAASKHQEADVPTREGHTSSHQPSVSGLSKHTTGVDMFRSSRPVISSSSRQAASLLGALGQADRRKASKHRHVKLLDVDEVKKLSRQTTGPEHAGLSAGAISVEPDEMEDGELEPGELPEEGEFAHVVKRPRQVESAGFG